MKKTIAFIFALIISFLGFGTATPVSAAPDFDEYNFIARDNGVRFYGEVAFGSPTDILLRGDLTEQTEKDRYTQVVRDMLDELIFIDSKISTTIKGSDIDNFNNLSYGGQVEVEYITFDIINLAKQMYKNTNYGFNPCVYYLVDLWEFSPRFLDVDATGFESQPYDRFYGLPDQKYIDAFLQLTDFDKVIAFENSGKYYLKKDCPSVTVDGETYHQKIDLGGIGKGYAADALEKMAYENDIRYGYLSVGGSSQILLKNADTANSYWPLELENPRMFDTIVGGYLSSTYMVLSVPPTSISSSGDYQRWYAFDNVRYSHIIDSATGKPYDTNLIMATVIGGSAAEGDCFSTALLTMGLEKAIEYVNSDYFKNKQLKFSLVYLNPKTQVLEVITNLDSIEFNLLNKHFYLASQVVNGSVVYTAIKKTNPIIYVLLACIPLLGLAILWRKGLIKKWLDKNKLTTTKLGSIKKSKYFYIGDIAVYVAVLVAIVCLFGFIAFGNEAQPLKKIEIYSGLKLIYSYDLTTQAGTLEDLLWASRVTISQVDGGIEITIMHENEHFNTVRIANGQAVMLAADCSNTKECVNNFAPVSAGNQVIICAVYNIRIVGVG